MFVLSISKKIPFIFPIDLRSGGGVTTQKPILILSINENIRRMRDLKIV